jgi:hypothetical protein
MDRSLGSERPNAVFCERAVLSRDEHRSLVADLAAIHASRLSLIPQTPGSYHAWDSTANFWASIRATVDGKVLFADDWCGYPSSDLEIRYAKVRAAALRALSFHPALEWAPYEPTEEDRVEAAARATGDMERLRCADCNCAWWMPVRLTGLADAIGPFSSLAQRSRWRAVRIRVVDPDQKSVSGASVKIFPSNPKGELRRDYDGIDPPHASGTWFVLLRQGACVVDVLATGFKAHRVPLTVGESSPQEIVVKLERE